MPEIFSFFFLITKCPPPPASRHRPHMSTTTSPLRLPHAEHKEHVLRDVFFVFGGSSVSPNLPLMPNTKSMPTRACFSCLASSCSRRTCKTCPQGCVLSVRHHPHSPSLLTPKMCPWGPPYPPPPPHLQGTQRTRPLGCIFCIHFPSLHIKHKNALTWAHFHVRYPCPSQST